MPNSNDITPLPHFWTYAECTNSHKPFDPGMAKYRMIFGKQLRKVRRWKDPRTGEKRVTVELDTTKFV